MIGSELADDLGLGIGDKLRLDAGQGHQAIVDIAGIFKKEVRELDARSGRENLGHALETCVMLELERRGAELAYVRNPDKSEVDFLARYPDGRQDLIQVAASIEDADARDREVRALLAAHEDHPSGDLHLITLDLSPPADLPPGVAWHWAAGWLLAGPPNTHEENHP